VHAASATADIVCEDHEDDNVVRFVRHITFPRADVSIAADPSTARLVRESGLSPFGAYCIEETYAHTIDTAGKTAAALHLASAPKRETMWRGRRLDPSTGSSLTETN
jgi:hypothetical protein